MVQSMEPGKSHTYSPHCSWLGVLTLGTVQLFLTLKAVSDEQKQVLCLQCVLLAQKEGGMAKVAVNGIAVYDRWYQGKSCYTKHIACSQACQKAPPCMLFNMLGSGGNLE